MFDCLPGRCLGVLLFALAASPVMAGDVSPAQMLPLGDTPGSFAEQVQESPPSRAHGTPNGFAGLDGATSAGAQLFVSPGWPNPARGLSSDEGLLQSEAGSAVVVNPSAVPEPASAALLLAGLVVLARARRQGVG